MNDKPKRDVTVHRKTIYPAPDKPKAPEKPNTSNLRKVRRNSLFSIFGKIDKIRKYEDIVDILLSGSGKVDACMYDDVGKCKFGRNCWECWRKFVKDNKDRLK